MPYHLALIVCLVTNLIVSLIVYMSYRKGCPDVGSIIIDRSDSDGPFMFFQTNMTIEELAKNDEVRIKIVEKDLVPRN